MWRNAVEWGEKQEWASASALARECLDCFLEKFLDKFEEVRMRASDRGFVDRPVLTRSLAS